MGMSSQHNVSLLAILAGAFAFMIICSGSSSAFLTPLSRGSAVQAARGSSAQGPTPNAAASWVNFTSGSLAVAACGLAAAAGMAHKRQQAKTAARYTTQVILPALTWLKTGIKASELAPRQLIAKTIGGNDVLIGKDEDGAVFCVANLCPHIGTPMSEGADVVGDIIVCPLHGSSFSTKTGELYDWCPSPPIIGPLTGLVVDKKTLLIFDSRTSFFGGEVEVLVDTNAKKAYEADYWKGILDAQGKNDGTWY